MGEVVEPVVPRDAAAAVPGADQLEAEPVVVDGDLFAQIRLRRGSDQGQLIEIDALAATSPGTGERDAEGVPPGSELTCVDQYDVVAVAAERREVDGRRTRCLTVDGDRHQRTGGRAVVAQPELVPGIAVDDERVLDRARSQGKRLGTESRAGSKGVAARGQPLQVEAGNGHASRKSVQVAVPPVQQDDRAVGEPAEVRVVAAARIDHSAVAERVPLVIAHRHRHVSAHRSIRPAEQDAVRGVAEQTRVDPVEQAGTEVERRP